MRVLSPERCFQFARRALRDDFAVVHDGDAIAEALGFFDIVRGHDNGFFFAAQLFDDVVNFAAHLRIEAGGRLVEEIATFGSLTSAMASARRCFWPPESWL